MTAEFILPWWPPSVNHCYGFSKSKKFLSKKAMAFRENVVAMLRRRQIPKFTGKVDLSIGLHPPDRRKRDIDNPLKSLLDALTHAGVYDDDSQIYKLSIEKLDIKRPSGQVDIRIKEYDIQREERTEMPAGP